MEDRAVVELTQPARKHVIRGLSRHHDGCTGMPPDVEPNGLSPANDNIYPTATSVICTKCSEAANNVETKGE